MDAAEIKIQVPKDRQADLISFLSEVENVPVQVDNVAKVVLNERTGTVVSGQNVKILPVTITHGSLNITIRSHPIISQPSPYSQGKTTTFNNLIPYVSQDSTKTVAIEGASNVQQVACSSEFIKSYSS